MSRRAPLTSEDIKFAASFAGGLAIFGALCGGFVEDEPLTGAFAGLILFVILAGTGWLANWASEQFERPWN